MLTGFAQLMHQPFDTVANEDVYTMALFRIETPADPVTGRYAVEIYFPHDAERPYVTTQPRYMTAAAAETDILAIIAAAANTGGKAEC